MACTIYFIYLFFFTTMQTDSYSYRKFVAITVGALSMCLGIIGTASAATTVIVTPTNTQGWSTADTRPGGAVTYVAGDAPAGGGSASLQLTTDLTTTSKAQYLHNTSTPLSSISNLSYWTKQVSAPFPGADPSYQLPSCLNGVVGTSTCSGFTTLVFEPYQGGLGPVVPGAWQQWNVSQGLFWSSRTVVCSNGTVVGTPGGPAAYTLAQIKTMCPSAVVVQFGVNIGSNNPGYTVRTDLVNFNGTTYNFEVANTPTNKDQCKNGGYAQYTDASGKPFTNQGQCVSFVKHQDAHEGNNDNQQGQHGEQDNNQNDNND